MFGSRPVGQVIPLPIASGCIEDGVLGDCLKSNMSVWLGAPTIRMKMTFFALFSIVTGCVVICTLLWALAGGRSSIAPLTPAPQSWKNCRREQCGRRKKGL